MKVDWSTNTFARLTGYTEVEIDARGGLESLVHPEDRTAFIAGYGAIAANRSRNVEFRIIDAHGQTRWLFLSIRPVWSESEQRVVQALGAFQDITERKRYEEQISQLAFYDSLTSLGNRRLLLDRLTRFVEDPPTESHILTVIYLDLDRFKLVNDTLGHEIGDALLIQVAERLRACVRDGDLLTRLGGDEFAVVLPSTNEEQAACVAQRMLDQFDPPFQVAGQDVRVGISVGIACYPRDGEQVGTLLQHADIAMYAAKAQGNRYRIYHPTLHTYREEQLQIESDLRAAIDNDDLTLHYQPIRDLRTNTIERVEALVRWIHPTRGPISPGVFIPIAEESGLIRALDRWVLRAGMMQAACWAQSDTPLVVAVNLSTVSLQERDLTAYVRACLAETGAPSSHLVIEITESAAMRDPSTTIGILNELRGMGTQIALDDFGRGYASLNYLASLPVDTVKVDREFVAEIGVNQKHEGVLRALITLCRSLGLTVVAEGVETDAQLRWLMAEGYDQAQGYFIGRPAPAATLAAAAPPVAAV
jgi:diguanylate cyclase (GGDEF)-like protein/PAS domain S-box-containing protein